MVKLLYPGTEPISLEGTSISLVGSAAAGSPFIATAELVPTTSIPLTSTKPSVLAVAETPVSVTPVATTPVPATPTPVREPVPTGTEAIPTMTATGSTAKSSVTAVEAPGTEPAPAKKSVPLWAWIAGAVLLLTALGFGAYKLFTMSNEGE